MTSKLKRVADEAVALGQMSGLSTAADTLEACAALGPALGMTPTQVIEETVAVLRAEAARLKALTKEPSR